jgi:hypothetical protein
MIGTLPQTIPSPVSLNIVTSFTNISRDIAAPSLFP